MQEWCCICPAYVGMSYTTDLGSWEFERMMVTDVVVVKKFQSQMGSHENWVMNGCGHIKFTTPGSQGILDMP